MLRPEIFDVLENTAPGKGGEIQLTDALQELAAEPDGPAACYGVVFRGRRYDTGDRLDYIKAIVQLALDRDDLGPELRPWLREFAATSGASVTMLTDERLPTLRDGAVTHPPDPPAGRPRARAGAARTAAGCGSGRRPARTGR